MYLSEAYLNDAYGTDQVAAMCPTAGALSTTIQLAEAAVESALRIGGYTTLVPPSVFTDVDDVPAVVKLAAYRQWLILAHDRRGIPIEADTLKTWQDALGDLREGRIEIDAIVNTTRGVGGNSFTDTTSTTSSGQTRAPVFSGENMGDF